MTARTSRSRKHGDASPGEDRASCADDYAALLAHFAVLHRGGAVLVNVRPRRDGPGEWMLLVQTVVGTLVWPVRDRHLGLFDRVARVPADDPRVEDLETGVARRASRLAALTDLAWQGTEPALAPGIARRHRRNSSNGDGP